VPIDAVEAQASDENLTERLPSTGVRRTQAEHVLRQLLHAVPPQTLQNAIRTMNQAVFPVLEASGAVDLAMLLGVTAMLCDAPLQRRCARRAAGAAGRPFLAGRGLERVHELFTCLAAERLMCSERSCVPKPAEPG
jgi:hypothetical protein